MAVLMYIIISFLCLVGIAAIIRGVTYKIFKNLWHTKLYHVILLGDDYPEIAIRDAVEQLNRSSHRASGGLFALDVGMSENSKQVAEIIARDYYIPLCDTENLGRILKEHK